MTARNPLEVQMLMWLLLYCLVAFSCADVEGDVRARTVFDYIEPQTGYTNLAVSRQVLRPDDVERWGHLLNASDAQLHQMQTQYARFIEEQNALLDREAPRLVDASAEIHLAREAEGYTQARSDRMARLLRHAARLRRQLEQVEQAYINTIEPFLTEQQVRLLPMLRNEAVRRHCHMVPSSIPWAHMDVRQIWEEVDQTPLSPDDREWVYEILWEHDLTVTPLIRNMADTFWNNRIDLARHLAAWQGDLISSDEYARRYERALEPFLRSSIRLGTLNESAVMQIAAAVPEEIAGDFLVRAKSAAFRHLYPDWYSLHTTFANVLADDELGQDVAAAVEAKRHSYEDAYRRLADEIERFYLDYAKQETLGRDGFRRQHLPKALAPMLQQRRELSQQWRQRLVETIGEDVIKRLGLDVSEPEEPEASEGRPWRPPF